MAHVNNFVASNCLCYLVNKYSKLAAKPLKVVMSEFYSVEELAEAKELLLKEVDSLKLENFPRISRRRRDSNSKPMLDIDDMFTAIAYLDENNRLKDIATFVATTPDGLPAVRLLEGDLKIVWNKLIDLGDIVLDLINSNKQCAVVNKSNSDILLRLERDITAMNASLANSKSNTKVLRDNKSADFINRRERGDRLNGADQVKANAEVHLARVVDSVEGGVDEGVQGVGDVRQGVGDVARGVAVVRYQQQAWGSLTSEISDAQLDSDGNNDEAFRNVISRKDRRLAKRKERSPNENTTETNRVKRHGNDLSYAAAITKTSMPNTTIAPVRIIGGNDPPTVSQRRSNIRPIIGKRDCET
jgi:hypothetical protein